MADEKKLGPVSIPRDAQTMVQILRAQGVHDFEPRVINQLLELMHRHVGDILEDAEDYKYHAGHERIEVDDIRLAVETRERNSFTQPPPREILMELAGKQNQAVLPNLPDQPGVLLPPEKFCLTAANYRVDSSSDA